MTTAKCLVLLGLMLCLPFLPALADEPKETSLPEAIAFVETVLKANHIAYSVGKEDHDCVIRITQSLTKQEAESLACALDKAIVDNDDFQIVERKYSRDWSGKFEGYPYQNKNAVRTEMNYQASLGGSYNIGNEVWIKPHGAIVLSGNEFKKRFRAYGSFDYDGLTVRFSIFFSTKNSRKRI